MDALIFKRADNSYAVFCWSICEGARVRVNTYGIVTQ